jgi:hypothetical protein
MQKSDPKVPPPRLESRRKTNLPIGRVPSRASRRHDDAGWKSAPADGGVFAEFEREMIRERGLAGQARARASGVRFSLPTIPTDKAAVTVADLKTGVGVIKLQASQRRDRPEAKGKAGRIGLPSAG